MADYIVYIQSAVVGIASTAAYIAGSTVVNSGITSTNGTRRVNNLSLNIGSAVPSMEPNRPVTGQLYPRFTK